MDISALDATEYEGSGAEIHAFTKGKESAKSPSCNKKELHASIAESRAT